MLRSLCGNIKNVATFSILFASFFAGTNVAAQTSACSVHDQMCIYHGIGRQIGYEPTGISSLTATANWDQANDGDLHALLPQSETYSAPNQAIPGYPLNINAPFYPNVTGSHIYPNHYGSEINGGDAIALHSGDDGGGVATYAGQPGCGGLQTSVSCEAIIIAGDVPSGVYSYALHAFPDTGTSFGLTNFDISVQAQGNMVLVVNDPQYIDPETGYVHQVGTYQGVNSVTSQLDVFALNVGHAGHVGGVTIPQMGAYTDTSGVQRYYPANPQDNVGLPTVADQIAMAFEQRDNLIDTYEAARAAEKRRRWIIQERQRKIREQQAERDREIIRLASLQATMDYCSQPNGVCAYKPLKSPLSFGDSDYNSIIELGNGRIPDPLGLDVYWIRDDNGYAYPFLKDDPSALTYPYFYALVAGGATDYLINNPVQVATDSVDTIQLELDIVSTVGVTGYGEILATPADAINTGISATRWAYNSYQGDTEAAAEHRLNTGLSATGLFPFVSGGVLKGGASVTEAIVKNGDIAADSFFTGTHYSDDVIGKMDQDLYHGFPEEVKLFETSGNTTTFIGGDGNTYTKLEIIGEYGSHEGTFEFIKDSTGQITHRFFNPILK